MKKTVVLIITCKKFESIWMPFFTLLGKYWNDCPYEIILGTDEGSYPGIKTISLGADFGWSNNCIQILKQIDADRIILFFEDFLPSAKFDTKRVEYLVKHSYDFNIGCLRLQPCPGPTAPWPYCKSLGILQRNDTYRFSLQTALWKKSLLLSLLKHNENPWQAEVWGTKRAKLSGEHFVSVKRGESPTPYIITAVVKGIWQDFATKLLIKEGIPTNNIPKTFR